MRNCGGHFLSCLGMIVRTSDGHWKFAWNENKCAKIYIYVVYKKVLRKDVWSEWKQG